MRKTNFTLLVLIVSVFISNAQVIPNGGFESWLNMGTYSNPANWDQLNATTASSGIFTCEQGTPGSAGSSCIKLTSKTVTGLGVMPGVAVCGVLNTTNYQALSGFAFTGQPYALTGKWQHMLYGSYAGFIDIQLTRWDNGTHTRITVASAHSVLSGMVMNWEAFNIPLNYTDSNAPDTCIITLSASGRIPANLDYLWVDELAFSATSGINEYDLNSKIELYPNPSAELLIIDLSIIKEPKVSIAIVDMQGKLVKSIENVIPSAATIIDINEITTGNYLLKVVSKHDMMTCKFIKK